jgi:ComF family protein
MSFLGRLAAPILDLAFPPRCISCRELIDPGRVLCRPCQDTLLDLPPGSCPKCAEPPPEATVGDGSVCRNCVERPPPYDRLYAPYVFGAAIADAIHRFKYEDRPHYARPLSQLVRESLADDLAWADVVVPVPLHRKRLIERRYDQAWLLAREIARGAGKRTEPRLVKRVRYTTAQVGRDRSARLANVAGAFQGSPKLRGLKVLLVDDVITTGSTMEAAAIAALSSGAAAVRGVALARAM